MTRPDISSGDRPLYVHTAAMTGILMSGNMSVGVSTAARPPNRTMRIARTMNVYGRFNARRTIATMAMRRFVCVSTQAPRGGWGNSHAALGARTDRKVAETSAVRVFCREDFQIEIGHAALECAAIRLQPQLSAGILLPAMAHGV